MKRTGLLLGLFSLILVWGITQGIAWQDESDPEEGEKKPRPLAKFMRGKLSSAQQVLEGLVTEDFDKIDKAALHMLTMAAAEEWRVSEDPLYAHHSEAFRKVAKSLRKRSADRDIEGAALQYVQLTLSCIECHRFVRDVILVSN